MLNYTRASTQAIFKSHRFRMSILEWMLSTRFSHYVLTRNCVPVLLETTKTHIYRRQSTLMTRMMETVVLTFEKNARKKEK